MNIVWCELPGVSQLLKDINKILLERYRSLSTVSGSGKMIYSKSEVLVFFGEYENALSTISVSVKQEAYRTFTEGVNYIASD